MNIRTLITRIAQAAAARRSARAARQAEVWETRGERDNGSFFKEGTK